MELNELRLGNFIAFDNKIGEVDSVSSSGVGVISEGSGKALLKGIITPILITEEWMLKFGFSKDEQGLFYNDLNGDFSGEFVTWFYRGDISIAPFAERNPKPNSLFQSISIRYVHQLQNLYFALTGDELTFQ